MEKMRYFLDPFGCVKNQVDAENMMSHLNNAGWESTSAEDADLIIVNSCGFIESAKQESIDAVIAWRAVYPGKKILLAGCLSQRYAKELAESLVEADGFLGVEDVAGIGKTVSDLFHAKAQRTQRTQREEGKREFGIRSEGLKTGERPLLSFPGSAYVKISEGCNNNCSYCAIPLIRGALVCREIADIVEECRTLLARGIKELCIIGQDIGSFGIDAQAAALSRAGTTSKLPELLDAISALEGHFWVRLLYMHPDHFPLQILDIMERDPRFLPYFDIPFQHASEKILRAMNRGDGAAKYLELIKTIRARLPDAVIRSTFLLGFPGETEEDFAQLLDFQQKAALDWLGCFTYSREEGTASFSMKGQVPAKTALMRKQMIEEKQISITEKSMDRFAGKKLEVLIEEHVDGESESFLLGRLYCQAPDIDGAAVIACSSEADNLPAVGSLVPCKVIARRSFDLEVELI